MSCNGCTDCNDCNDCAEECGCAVEITSLSCVRHDGNDMPCLEVVTGDTLEAILQKIENKICDGTSGSVVDGIDGIDGQGIDHAAFLPNEPGDVAGGVGQTDTYTIWGDAAETINLGTFSVYNGANGIGVDHSSFTSTDGVVPTAGESGQTDTYTVWADALETVPLGTFIVKNGGGSSDVYDSGWHTIPDYVQANNFGLAEFSNGWEHPKVRVVGKTVFLEGFLMIPLATTGEGSILIDDVATYSSTQRTRTKPYSGAYGGYASTGQYQLKTVSPILPNAITPTAKHLVSSFEITYRPILDAKNSHSTALNTIFKDTYLNTDGTFQLTTMAVTEAEAPGLIGPRWSSPLHILISKTSTRGEASGYMPDYSGHKTQYDATVDQRNSPISSSIYPTDFDGNIASYLGGFRIRLTTSYPLGENVTQTEIAAAISLIQN